MSWPGPKTRTESEVARRIPGRTRRTQAAGCQAQPEDGHMDVSVDVSVAPSPHTTAPQNIGCVMGTAPGSRGGGRREWGAHQIQALTGSPGSPSSPRSPLAPS